MKPQYELLDNLPSNFLKRRKIITHNITGYEPVVDLHARKMLNSDELSIVAKIRNRKLGEAALESYRPL